MVFIKRILCLVITLFDQSVLACEIPVTSQKAPITIFTELWPPYQELDQNDRLSGIATQKITPILDSNNISYTINVMPWARALQLAKQTKNSLIYSISRTTERESQYHWIYAIDQVRTYLVSLAGRKDMLINKLEDILNYTLILKRDDATNNFFLNLGFVPNKNIIFVNDSEHALRLIAKGRADFYPMVHASFQKALETYPEFIEQFELAFELKPFQVELYLATDRLSDEAFVSDMKKVFHCTSK